MLESNPSACAMAGQCLERFLNERRSRPPILEKEYWPAPEKKEKTPPLTTQPVSVPDNHAALGIPAPRSATASLASARATTARGSQRSPRRSSEGGGR